jgi:hypothetical protein
MSFYGTNFPLMRIELDAYEPVSIGLFVTQTDQMRRAESVRELRTARCRRSKKPISTAAGYFDSQITNHRHPSRRHRHPSRRHPSRRCSNRRCSSGRCSNRRCSNRRSNSTAAEAAEPRLDSSSRSRPTHRHPNRRRPSHPRPNRGRPSHLAPPRQWE